MLETGQTPAERIFARQNPKKQNYTNDNSVQKIGTGTFGAMTFPRNVNRTFIMNFTVSYTPSADRGALNDPAMNEIIQLCVDAPDTRFGRRTSLITYQATAGLRPLSSIGLAPKLGGSIRINCPFQGEARELLISAIKGGVQNGGAQGTVPVSNNTLNAAKRLRKPSVARYQPPFAYIGPDMIRFV
jgi:hypothetical protein